MSDNTPQANQQGLAQLAARVREKHAQVSLALGNALNFAMDAGDALLEARSKVPVGWQAWVRDKCDLNERTVRVYLQVAKSRALLERQSSAGRPLSIAAALEYLKDPGNPDRPKKPALKKKKAASPKLSSLAWSEATPDQRRQFLRGVGLTAVLAAMPSEWRAELGRRVQGQRSAAASPLADKVTKVLRTALSHGKLKTDHDKANALASLNGIHNLLAAQGLDLHDIEITLTAKPTTLKAA